MVFRADSSGVPKLTVLAGVLTDSLGRFTLRPPGPGRYAVDIRHIVYRTRRVWIEVGDNTVVYALLALGRASCSGDVCY